MIEIMTQTKDTLSEAVFTILIVDDSHFTLLTQSMLIKQLGYRVLMAASAKHALEILSKQHIDLVITDINMPEMRGDELAAQIQRNFSDLPVVAATTACIEELRKINKANFEVILKKPLTPCTIKQTMRNYLPCE